MGICCWRPRLALNVLLPLALPVAILAPVSAAPTVAALGALSVDGGAPAASDTTCRPCKTIQGALNLAGPGASITVAPGTYHETLTITQSVSIGGVARLPGEQGPTIVDAGGTGRVVTIPNGVPSDVQVSLTSLTLTGGVAPAGSAPTFNAVGGGIAALGGTVSLSDTTVMRNTAHDGGGGIETSGGTILVLTSTIASNTAGACGGLVVDGGVATLRNSAVVSNTATIGAGGGSLNNGGGILNFNSGSLNIINSTLSGNSATTSGGAIASTGSLAVSFSTISANSAPSGGGIAATGGGATRPGQRVVLLLANPSAATVRVVATLHGNDGRTVQQHVTLPPYGQSTLDVGRIFQRATGVHGVRVTSANGEGFLAEQTVFAADGSTLQRTQGLAQ